MGKKLLLAAVSAALVQGSYGFNMCANPDAFMGTSIAYGACMGAMDCKTTCNDLQYGLFDNLGSTPSFDVCTTANPTLGGISPYYFSTLLQGDCCAGSETSCGGYQSANKICKETAYFNPTAPLDMNDADSDQCHLLNAILPMTGLLGPNAARDGYSDIDCSATVSEAFSNNPQFHGIPKRAADLAGIFGASCCTAMPSVCEDERSTTQFCKNRANFKPDALTMDPANEYRITCKDVQHQLPLYIASQGGSAPMMGNTLNAQDCLLATMNYETDFVNLMKQYVGDCCLMEDVYNHLCNDLTVGSPCMKDDDCYDDTYQCVIVGPDDKRRKLFFDDKEKEDPKDGPYGMCKRIIMK